MTTDPRSSIHHVLLCYLGPAHSDRVLPEVAALCRAWYARLSLVLPVVDEAVARGCCGVQGDAWRRLVDDDARHALRDAAQTLRRLNRGPEEAALQTGASVEDIVAQTAVEWNCDVVAAQIKRRPWSVGLSRRQADAIRLAQPSLVVALGKRG